MRKYSKLTVGNWDKKHPAINTDNIFPQKRQIILFRPKRRRMLFMLSVPLESLTVASASSP